MRRQRRLLIDERRRWADSGHLLELGAGIFFIDGARRTTGDLGMISREGHGNGANFSLRVAGVLLERDGPACLDTAGGRWVVRAAALQCLHRGVHGGRGDMRAGVLDKRVVGKRELHLMKQAHIV